MADVPLRVPNKNFFGVFLTPFPAGSVPGSYESFNLSAFTAQIDAVKSIGANCVSFFGSVGAITTVGGTLSLGNTSTPGTYLYYRKQIFDYILSQGMYFITIGTDTFNNWSSDNSKDTAAAAVLAADAALCDTYSNCLGYITVDEVFAGPVNTSAPLVARIATMYNAAKNAVTTLPICGASNGCGNVVGANVWNYTGQGKTNLDSVINYCDFFDFHPFYAAALVDTADLRAFFPNKQIVMSSIVAGTNDAVVATQLTAINALVGANNFRFSSVFTCLDFDANQYGMFNSDLSPRTTRTNAFTASLTNYVIRKQVTLLSHVQKTGSLNGGTSTAIDTTGATGLVIHSSQFFPGSGPVAPTDSAGNTWTQLAAQLATNIIGGFYYAQTPVKTSATHTFTIAGSGVADTSCMAAFKGPINTGVPLVSGSSVGTIASANSIQLPNLDPPSPYDFSLVLTGLCYGDSTSAAINQGFTIVDQSINVPGVAIGGALAYKVQVVANTANPTYSWTNAGNVAITGMALISAPATVPNAPTIGTAVAGTGNATVPFTESTDNGGQPITGHTATSTPGSVTGSNSSAGSGSILVTGLPNGTPVTFTVHSTNIVGNSAESASSNSVTPTGDTNIPPGGRGFFVRPGSFMR